MIFIIISIIITIAITIMICIMMKEWKLITTIIFIPIITIMIMFRKGRRKSGSPGARTIASPPALAIKRSDEAPVTLKVGSSSRANQSNMKMLEI